MSQNSSAKLFDRIQTGYNFRLGDYISKGWNIFSHNMGLFVGYTLVCLGINIAASVIPVVGSLALMVINPVLTIGPFIVANCIDRNEPYEFKTFFKGFDKLGPLFVAYLIQILVIIAATLPGLIVLFSSVGLSLFSGEGLGGTAPVGSLSGFLLVAIPAIYLSISYTLAFPLVWFYDLQPWQALETSRKLVGKQWFIWLIFLFVLGLLVMAGLIVLIVGVLLAIPAVTCALYAAMADVTGLNEQIEAPGEGDITRHFGDMP